MVFKRQTHELAEMLRHILSASTIGDDLDWLRCEPVQAAGPDDGQGSGAGDDYETGIATKTRPKTKRPSMYKVLLLNDDYTPMEFVVMILQDIFNKSSEDAWQIMMHVHKQGVGQCGVYPFEVAETKVTRVMDAARKNQHPLQCVMEKQ